MAQLDFVQESTKSHVMYTTGVVLIVTACLALTIAAWGFGWTEGYAAAAGVSAATIFSLLVGGFHSVECHWRSL